MISLLRLEAIAVKSIDDESIAETSRKAVDEMEARYAEAYARNGNTEQAQYLLDRVGK